MKQPPSIQRFFNEVGPASGPFDLLGVDPQGCTDDAVNAALKRRLDRLLLHPHASTPEAEEVRLALHVAAAQLLDPQVRAELLQDHRLTQGAAPSSVHATTDSFEDAAFVAIASAGGWNVEARRRLAIAAAAQGVGPRDAVRLIARLARAWHTSPGPISHPSPPDASTLDGQTIAERRTLRRWGAFAVLILLVVSTVLIALRLVTIAGQLGQALPAPEADRDAAPSATDAEPAPRRDASPNVNAARPGAAPSPVITPSRHPRASVESAPEAPVAPRSPLSDPVLNLIARAEGLLTGPTDRDVAAALRLAKAVQLARLNLAARLLWKSDSEGAERALNDAEKSPDVTTSPLLLDLFRDPVALTSPGVEPDGALAIELWALRRQPGLGLDAFKNRRFTHVNLGPVDCDAAAETALFGSPQDLRLLARRIVTDQADNPAMINALLEALPRASRQSPLSALIVELTERTLPDIDTPAWPIRARAALIERLAELLAPGVQPGIDALAEMLAAAYEGKDADSTSFALPIPIAPGPVRPMPDSSTLQPADPVPGPIPLGDSRSAASAVDALWRSWLDEAGAYRALRSVAQRLDIITRDRAARLSLAQGPVQRFVAMQSSIVDLMAIVVEQEQPGASVADLIDQARVARRAAADTFAQIEVNERAMARLWIIRFGGENRGGGR